MDNIHLYFTYFTKGIYMKTLSLEACKKVVGAGVFDPEQPKLYTNNAKDKKPNSK
jgi:hypothetical protein